MIGLRIADLLPDDDASARAMLDVAWRAHIYQLTGEFLPGAGDRGPDAGNAKPDGVAHEAG